jgi:hypothetical protein
MQDSLDKESTQRSLFLREKAMHDKVSRENYYKRQMAAAMEKGISLEEQLAELRGESNGIGIGSRRGRQDIIKRLAERGGFSVYEIAGMTGLTPAQVKELLG